MNGLTILLLADSTDAASGVFFGIGALGLIFAVLVGLFWLAMLAHALTNGALDPTMKIVWALVIFFRLLPPSSSCGANPCAPMKHSSFLPPFIAGVAMVFAAIGSLVAADEINRTDKSFIQSAYEEGLAEVKMGELGVAKTANQDVKAFAQQMVTDHGNANTELKALADARKVTVAQEPTMVAKGKAKMIDAKSGADFDRSFADGMVADHKKAVEAFEKASVEVKDGDLKAFVDKTLPALKHHLSMAEELQKKVGGK